MTPLTRQQIAEKDKYNPKNPLSPKSIARIAIPISVTMTNEEAEQRIKDREIIESFITDLQKETWDAACEAFRFKAIEAITMINPRFEHEIGAVTDLELPPYPEK